MGLRPITPADVDALQDLIESDPGYTERITGYPPGASDAQSLLMMRPEELPEVHASHQGRGYGRTTYELVQQYVETTWPVRPYRYDKLESSARLYEKQLAK